MELSQKLKELRKKQGLTQLELAERLFVSRQAISGWEAGTSRPSTENLQSLSRLFNIPLETLLNMIPPSRDITGLETAHIRRILPCMLMVVAGIGQLLGLRP